MNPQIALRLLGISKAFDNDPVLAGISFDLFKGEIVAILGPSGCGKSTLLMIIAGIEKQDAGDVYWNGTLINELPPHRRGFGLMFQDYVLFPHLSVYDNVAFGLRMDGLDKPAVEKRTLEAMNLVGLKGFDERDVNSLSGGEQQRVALARSLAPYPKLLMLDEPLASIDRSLRDRLTDDLRTILQGLEQTAIYVTHDQEEAFAIADRIVLMNEGMIEQIGTPEEIYRSPASLFTAKFLGLTNTFSGTALKRGQYHIVETILGTFPHEYPFEGPVTVLLRHDAAKLDGQGELSLTGRLIAKSFRGNICQAVFLVNEIELEFNFLSTTELPDVGEIIQFSIDPQQAILLYPMP